MYQWQKVLGGVLGFFIVGPLLTALLTGGGAGSVELLLGAAIGGVVGVVSAASVARSRTERER
jgi:predicted lipid-binding transport protein (Tim44 family)